MKKNLLLNYQSRSFPRDTLLILRFLYKAKLTIYQSAQMIQSHQKNIRFFKKIRKILRDKFYIINGCKRDFKCVVKDKLWKTHSQQASINQKIQSFRHMISIKLKWLTRTYQCSSIKANKLNSEIGCKRVRRVNSRLKHQKSQVWFNTANSL